MNINIKNILNNKNNGYYGHGTGGSDDTINSIFKYGLRCSHDDMRFTTMPLGPGQLITDSTIRLLHNWPHHNFHKIIIVSLPIKYHILDLTDLGTYQERYGAFCYIPSEEQQKEGNLTNSRYVRPEFIVGCYNAKIKSFKFNSKYYEHMSLEQRKEFLKLIKDQYIEIINNGCGIYEYKEIIENLKEWKFPLTDEDLIQTKK